VLDFVGVNACSIPAASTNFPLISGAFAGRKVATDKRQTAAFRQRPAQAHLFGGVGLG
jgi:hypothetical protein